MEGDPGLEVFVRNVPVQATGRGLAKFLAPILSKLSIRNFECQKGREKSFANVTFLKLEDGRKFLKEYGQQKVPFSRYTTTKSAFPANKPRLFFLNRPIYCEMSNRQPNTYTLRVLAKEEKEAQTLQVVRGETGKEKPILPVILGCSYVSCGTWAYVNGELEFMTESTWPVNGGAKFGLRNLQIEFASGKRLIMPYSSMHEILTQVDSTPVITFTLHEAPRFLEEIEPGLDFDSLLAGLAKLNLKGRGPRWRRLRSIDNNHQKVAGICLVYRLGLSETSTNMPGHVNVVGDKIQALRNAREVPPLIHHRTKTSFPPVSYASDFEDLLNALSATTKEPPPFRLAFQLQKLAQNNYLPPKRILQILPEIRLMVQRLDLSVCVGAVRKMFKQIPYPGTGTDASDLSTEALCEMLNTNAAQATESSYPENILSQAALENVAIIHRVTVTPAGLFLSGPQAEAKNRLLRKYPEHHEYFLRVDFSDENGEQIYFDAQTSLEEIYHGRFKDVLRNGLTIAGRNFQFLGFSHASLRARATWFMAPFYQDDGTRLDDRMVIGDLGNFSQIRSPAKCAARIGQAFSDTPNAIHIDPSIVISVVDVQVKDRVFSDGVGTISQSIMEKIWAGMSRNKGPLIVPTCYQIRYKGAKGMVALDSRLSGDVVALRPSMIKFEGSNDPDLELCGAARKPLPMKLNRQFIKIMEDLGVENSFFIDLQAKEVNRLRQITDDAYNAATFLKTQAVGDAIFLPGLMRELIFLNIDFRADHFLRDVLEMSILLELRTLKHRARIPVPQGYVLHGIMDETGILEEGQIFCIVNETGVPYAITGDVMITRAPALHPGDIQVVKAVSVPENSPLMQLSNCICFSQKGLRDLPSQLSGGDLDGDLYHIMWDPTGFPKWTFPPADYPRQNPLDIGREVTREDMTDFFVKFMETDQLGRVCNNHLILADQVKEGTLHPDCIKLAEIASIAVDFSKTGIPADTFQMPRPVSRWRPDFMAPGPHVQIVKKEAIALLDPNPSRDENDEDDEEFSGYRYYESDKVLGSLYRAIDEHGIFKQIQERLSIEGHHDFLTVIPQVWKHVQYACRGFQWEHLLEEARGIRDMYEDCLLNIMTEFSDHPMRPISENEAFIGNILGKTGAQSKRQRELSSSMKEQFDRDTGFIVNCILRNDRGYSEEALERSIACLEVSLEERRVFKRSEQLTSFKYLAASICLREVKRTFNG